MSSLEGARSVEGRPRDGRGARILHLLFRGSPADGSLSDECELACAAARRIRDAEHEVWVVGDPSPPLTRDIEPAGVIPFPPGAPGAYTARRLRLALQARRGAGNANRLRESFDIVISWAPTPSRVASRLARSLALPCVSVCSAAPATDAPPDRFLTDDTCLTLSPAHRRAWVRGGARDARLAPPPTVVVDHSRRDAARRALGLAPGDTAVLLLGDPRGAADARRFAFILGLLTVAGVRVSGIVLRGAGQWARAIRFTGAHDSRWRMIHAAATLADVLPACDLAVWDPPRLNSATPRALPADNQPFGDSHEAQWSEHTWGELPIGGALSVHIAIAGGLPTIAPRDVAPGALVPPHLENALLAPGSLRSFAARLLPLARDASLRADVSGALRRHVHSAQQATPSFEEVLRELWQARSGHAERLRLGSPGARASVLSP